jgi:hypothetical protein
MKKKFKVHVCRTAYAHLYLEVEADTQEEAEKKALDEAGDHSFSENNTDYTVEGTTEL